MTVSSVCNYNVATIDADADVLQAAVLMRQEHVGDLIVTEQRDGLTVPVGVVTDRDIVVGIVAKNIQASDVRVGDTVRAKLVTVHEDNGIGFALREMRRAGVRRVPVVNSEGQLVGVLSVDDAIDHLATQLGDIAGTIRFQQDLESKQRP
jgi:CBS domain-containing protein